MSEHIRKKVHDFYAKAAKEPLRDLCCPVTYSPEYTSHIPEDVLKISYGCGSPVMEADIKEGETVLDLGSGGGVDCFIGARLVGPSGRITGVDMTDDMLLKAGEAKKAVAENLGYDVVEFKKGLLEDIPCGDAAFDLVISNCVINLSGDKDRVFGEMYRVLNDRGRFCIADVVAEEDVPEEIRSDTRLWGECIAGAMREDEFIRTALDAGFYGLHVTKRDLYRVVEGIRFYSITLKGYKFKKGKECVYKGQYAIYNGPFSSVHDDDGHEYPVGKLVEVCTDTAEKLKNPPYRGLFTVIEKDGEGPETPCCEPEGGGSSPCC